MNRLLKEEDYQTIQQEITKGIKDDIKNNPKNEWEYRALYWVSIQTIISDRLLEILNLMAHFKPSIDDLKEFALKHSESLKPVTIEEYYNILADLEEDDLKTLIFDIKDLPYQSKCEMIERVKEKNFEGFKTLIYNNIDCSIYIEKNTILAQELILFNNQPFCYVDNVDQLQDFFSKSYMDLLYAKFPSITDFDFRKVHSDDEWKLLIEEQKWVLGVTKHLFGILLCNTYDFDCNVDLTIENYLICKKVNQAAQKIDKRVITIFNHIPVPQEAYLVKKNMLECRDYQHIVELTRQIKQLASSDKAGKIALKIKSHFKNVFLVESCKDFGGKTRYEMFVSLLDDFVNGKPKPKDYQILAKTIYYSMYFIREDNEDKKLPWKSWYKEFCSASGCVYRESYEDQTFNINKKVECFESIFPLDPKIKHDKKRKKRAD